MKWFVEIICERAGKQRLEECGSLREARLMAERAEGEVEFNPSTDSIAIYRGNRWHTAKFYE